MQTRNDQQLHAAKLPASRRRWILPPGLDVNLRNTILFFHICLLIKHGVLLWLQQPLSEAASYRHRLFQRHELLLQPGVGYTLCWAEIGDEFILHERFRYFSIDIFIRLLPDCRLSLLLDIFQQIHLMYTQGW
jgi:hypothetical protein